MAAIIRAILVFTGLATALLTVGVADADALSGTLYVTDFHSPGAVVPIPLSSLTAGSAITSAIGAYPAAVAISPGANRAFTANEGSATMSAIATATNTASEVDLTAFGGPLGIAVSPNGSQVFLTTSVGVAIVDAHTLAVDPSTIPVGNDPQGIAFTPDGKFAYVANTNDGTVSVIDTSSDTVTTTISLGLPAKPCALAVTPNGAKVVVIGGCYSNSTGGVSIITTATNNATAINSFGADPFEAVAMSPSGKAAYVYDNTTGDIWRVDPRTGAIPANPLVSGQGGIRGLALSPSGSRLFATRSGSGTVSMINPLSAAVTPISTSANVPWADAVTPDQAPHAALSATAAPAGSATKLSAAGTTTYDGGAAKYAWRFGDGATKATTTPTVSHVYSTAGNYTATVTVTDDQGCSTKLIYTGQTASCNGRPRAKKSVSFAVPADTSAPQATPPVQTLVHGAQLGTSTVPVHFNWSAADNLTPAGSILSTLEQRTNSSGSWSVYSNLVGPTTAKTAMHSFAPGTIYRQFRIAARDQAGNVGYSAAGPAFRVNADQESSSTIAYSGTWHQTTQGGAFGGSVRYSTQAGAKATLTSTARNLAVVAPLTSTGGTARVCLDPGTTHQSCSTVDLSPSSGLGARKEVFVRNGLSPSTIHHVRVTVVSGRVDLDAFVALR